MKERTSFYIFLVICSFLGLISSKHRHYYPLTNVLVARVLPIENNLQWFIDKDMPYTEEIKTQFKEGKVVLGSIKTPVRYDDDFVSWIKSGNARKTYRQFLLEDPINFLLKPFGTHLRYGTFFNWIKDVKFNRYGRSLNFHLPFHPYQYWHHVILFLGVILVIIKRNIKVLMALAMHTGFIIIVWHADFIEVERHALMAIIATQIIIISEFLKTVKNFNISKPRSFLTEF